MANTKAALGQGRRRLLRSGRRRHEELTATAVLADYFGFHFKRRRPLRTALGNQRRLIWRYRVQLAPIALVSGIWLGGEALHLQPPGQHPVRLTLVVAVVLTLAVWLFPRRVFRRVAERLYATVCLAAATWWAMLATTYGTGRPMPALLVGGGSVLAVPWWWHHHTRYDPVPASELETIWAERVGAEGKILPRSALVEVAAIPSGVRAAIELPPGEKSTNDAIAVTERVTSALKAVLGTVSIEPDPEGYAHRARLTYLPTNPLRQVQLFPGPSLDLATGMASIGVYADGQPVPYRFYRPDSGPWHDLICGTTDGGKSRLLDQLLALERHAGGYVVSWVIDPQRGQSLPEWKRQVDWFARSVEEGLVMLRTAQMVLYARNQYLADLAWTDHKGRAREGKDHFTPTLELALISLTVEEAHAVLRIKEAKDICEDLGKMGRKCGLKLRLVTQVPLLDQLGGSMTLRDMVAAGNVVVLRTANRLSGTVAFNGALPVDPHTLPKQYPDGSTTAGLGFALGAGDRPVTMRLYYVDDPYHWATTGVTTPLDTISVRAAGADYADRHERRLGAHLPARVQPARLRLVPGLSAEAAGSATDKVLAVLEAEGGEMETGAVIKAAQISPRTVNHVLARLVEDGRVVKLGKGRYMAAEDDETGPTRESS